MKHVIVTGAGSGIGKSLSKKLLEQGYTPVLIGRSLKKLQETAKELNNSPYFSVDLSKESSIKELQKGYASLEQGVLKGVVNNAGVFKPMAFENTSTDDWLSHYENNLLTSINTSKAFLELLKKYGGSIVNVSSTLGLRPIANTSAYSASKAALINLSQSMAIELAPYKIRVNTVCPGIVDTPIHQPENRSTWKTDASKLQPLGRIGEPEDISGVICHLISEDSKWTTGTVIPVDGGILLNS